MHDLIPQYRKMADTGLHFRGLSILQHRVQIAQLCLQHKVRTLLDYGCGAGEAYEAPHSVHEGWGVSKLHIRRYDPAFKHFRAKIEGRFDGVLCSDVLEHIPEADVDAAVRELFWHARSFVWASICSRPAGKTFEDGTNLHVTQRPLAWWTDKFNAVESAVPFYLVETP